MFIEANEILIGLAATAIGAGVDALFAETRRRARNFVRRFYLYIVIGIVAVVSWQLISPATRLSIKAYATAIPMVILIIVACAYLMFRAWDADFSLLPIKADEEDDAR